MNKVLCLEGRYWCSELAVIFQGLYIQWDCGFHNLHHSPCTVKTMKPRKFRWSKLLTLLGNRKRHAYRILVSATHERVTCGQGREVDLIRWVVMKSLRISPVADFCDDGDKPSGFLREGGGTFLSNRIAFKSRSSRL
jgi:hypothetical protein